MITTENVQFIEQYLKKSEVVFDDLRIELVDHIATAVSFKMVSENIDFYDAFKIYMVEHKKSILKAGMVNHTINLKMAASKFGGFLLGRNIVIFSVVYLSMGIKNLKISIVENLFLFEKIVTIYASLLGVIWFVMFYVIFKKRIFALENNLVIIVLYYYIVNFLMIFWRENSEIEFYIVLISGLYILLFNIYMCQTSINFYKKYVSIQNYKMIN